MEARVSLFFIASILPVFRQSLWTRQPQSGSPSVYPIIHHSNVTQSPKHSTSVQKKTGAETWRLRSEIFAALAALLLCSIFSLAAQDSAQPGARRRFGLQERPFGMEGGWGARLPGGLMLGKLDLSDAQKEQVNTLVTANHAAVEPYRNQLRDSAKALREATANGQFDEAQIRTIAQTQAQANAALT